MLTERATFVTLDAARRPLPPTRRRAGGTSRPLGEPERDQPQRARSDESDPSDGSVDPDESDSEAGAEVGVAPATRSP